MILSLYNKDFRLRRKTSKENEMLYDKIFFNFFVFQDNSRRGFRDIFLSFFEIFVQALVLAVIRNCLYSSIRAKTMFHGFLVKSVDGIHRLLIYFGLSFTGSRCRGGVALIGVTVG